MSATQRNTVLEQLRAQVSRLERGSTVCDAVPLCAPIDGWLPDNGLLRGAVHEVLSGDEGAAVGFCAMVLGRLGGTVAWIAPEPDAAPEGLRRFGLEPAAILFVAATEPADALWAMEEALRCSALAGALLVTASPGLAAARRLQLAAEAGGGLGLLLRPDEGAALPTAALTRWRVAAAHESSTGSAAPSRQPRWQPRWQFSWQPSWRLELLRARAGRAGQWQVRWEAETRRLAVETTEGESAGHEPLGHEPTGPGAIRA
ncbi:ImuA family protein [Roseomonas elaeocarpi]|uniref:ImuA family protein n=1 Tax=Roseomonas elaeocarpi TaxID=907779 RepID=A0ABV6JMB9_9PROT